jgi:hypothetical protein
MHGEGLLNGSTSPDSFYLQHVVQTARFINLAKIFKTGVFQTYCLLIPAL